MRPTIIPNYFDLPGARDYLGGAVSVRVLRDYIKEGSLPHIRLRGKILLARHDIDSWLAKHRHDVSRVENLVTAVMREIK